MYVATTFLLLRNVKYGHIMGYNYNMFFCSLRTRNKHWDSTMNMNMEGHIWVNCITTSLRCHRDEMMVSVKGNITNK